VDSYDSRTREVYREAVKVASEAIVNYAARYGYKVRDNDVQRIAAKAATRAFNTPPIQKTTSPETASTTTPETTHEVKINTDVKPKPRRVRKYNKVDVALSILAILVAIGVFVEKPVKTLPDGDDVFAVDW